MWNLEVRKQGHLYCEQVSKLCETRCYGNTDILSQKVRLFKLKPPDKSVGAWTFPVILTALPWTALYSGWPSWRTAPPLMWFLDPRDLLCATANKEKKKSINKVQQTKEQGANKYGPKSVINYLTLQRVLWNCNTVKCVSCRILYLDRRFVFSLCVQSVISFPQ